MNKYVLPLIVFLIFFLGCITEKVGLVAQTNQNAAIQKNNPIINRLQSQDLVNFNGWEFLSWKTDKINTLISIDEYNNIQTWNTNGLMYK